MREERIGDCRLILGDSIKLLPTLGRLDSMVTDPPYGMAFRSNHRKEKHGFIEMDRDGFAMQWAASLGPWHSSYIWMRWDNLAHIPKRKSLVTWVKNNWSMGDLDHEHARQTEVCAFYAGPEHFWPTGRPSDVITCPRTGNDNHPTEKPVPLMRAVVEWTAGTVFDPFMGSGTTGVACAKLRRAFVGVEIDPQHFEIACRRVEEAYRQPDLFIAPPPQPKQESLL
jgi:site-specific DNA-methyltransferase (adenine-specific)